MTQTATPIKQPTALLKWDQLFNEIRKLFSPPPQRPD